MVDLPAPDGPTTAVTDPAGARLFELEPISIEKALRRAVEQDMRAGRIDGIVSTSALELGVDIGSLDVVVLNGYPGSISATWQRFGRAGRRQQPSLGVLVASSEALDQYVVRHPEFFAAASPEHARIEPDQPLILLDHVRCAAFELPFEECIGECQWFWLLEGDCGYEALGCFGPSRCERDLDCASWQSCITVEKRTCGPHPLEPAVCLSCGVTPVQLCLPGAEPT